METILKLHCFLFFAYFLHWTQVFLILTSSIQALLEWKGAFTYSEKLMENHCMCVPSSCEIFLFTVAFYVSFLSASVQCYRLFTVWKLLGLLYCKLSHLNQSRHHPYHFTLYKQYSFMYTIFRSESVLSLCVCRVWTSD